MLRNERPRIGEDGLPNGVAANQADPPAPRDLFIGEPSSLKGHSYAISGWPDWLIPTYQLKGHRPQIRLLEEER